MLRHCLFVSVVLGSSFSLAFAEQAPAAHPSKACRTGQQPIGVPGGGARKPTRAAGGVTPGGRSSDLAFLPAKWRHGSIL